MSLAIDNELAVPLFHVARNYPPNIYELGPPKNADVGPTNLLANLSNEEYCDTQAWR